MCRIGIGVVNLLVLAKPGLQKLVQGQRQP